MGHVGKKGALCLACVLCRFNSGFQSKVHPAVIGAVGKIDDTLLFPLNIAAESDHMEETDFVIALMDKLFVPFLLFSVLHPCQIIQSYPGFCAAFRMAQNPDILLHIRGGNAQELLNVGTDIFHLFGSDIQRQENIINIVGQSGEKLIPGKQRAVPLSQLQSVFPDDPCDNHQGQANSDSHHQHDGGRLEIVHTGIDHTGGHDAKHDPVLNPGLFIKQIIFHAAQTHDSCAGTSLPEILPHGRDFLTAQIGIFFQHCQEIIDIFLLVDGLVHDDPAIGMDHIAAGLSVKGGYLKYLHHVEVVVADCDGIVCKALIDTVGSRHGEHQNLRFTRHHRAHYDVLPAAYLIGQAVFQVKITLFAVCCHIVAIQRDKIEVGKPRLFSCAGNKILNLFFITDVFQILIPGMQIAPVRFNQITQGTVILMEDLRQMGNTLCIDRPRHDPVIVDGGSDNSHKQYNRSNDDAPPFSQEISLLSVK